LADRGGSNVARVSLNRRLERLKDHLVPPGSLEHALDNLSDDQRLQYQIWLSKADAINLQGENLYAAMLSDPLSFQRTSSALYALFPYFRDVDNEPDPERAYQIMLQQGIKR
jgi:hypothetical protein